MYRIGDYLVKEGTGLCKITDIAVLDCPGVKKERKYYFLEPCLENNSKIYLPVDRAEEFTRKAMNAEEAEEILDEITQFATLKVSNEKEREPAYKKALKSNEPRKWGCLIKSISERKQQREKDGKKLGIWEEHYFLLAQNYLCSELSLALGRSMGELKTQIEDSITITKTI